jgi:hypothetical protein
MEFMSERFLNSLQPDGGLPIMFTIRGETDIPELELSHLDGYRGSKPVRIGNGAAFHHQFDIYGELMDAIYLYNKYGKPVTWDQWVSVRRMLDYVLGIINDPDMSIWEVRNNKQNFTYSKIMLWVAFDRGLRLADKRNLPCPNRFRWLQARDNLYEEIMHKGMWTFPWEPGQTIADFEAGYNEKLQCFVQSYENREIIDSSILIAPLVFFIGPNDPRFLQTMDRILQPPEKGGLTSTGLVYRYNTELSADGKVHTIAVREAPSIRANPTRGGRPRRRLQHVHLLAGGGYDASSCARAKVSYHSDQLVRKYAQLFQPSPDVFRRNRSEWRTAGQHTTGFQPFGACERRLQPGQGVRGENGGKNPVIAGNAKTVRGTRTEKGRIMANMRRETAGQCRCH